MKKLMTALSVLALFAVGAISTAQARSHCDDFYTSPNPLAGACTKVNHVTTDKSFIAATLINQVVPSDGKMVVPLDTIALNADGTGGMNLDAITGSSGKNVYGGGHLTGHLLI